MERLRSHRIKCSLMFLVFHAVSALHRFPYERSSLTLLVLTGMIPPSISMRIVGWKNSDFILMAAEMTPKTARMEAKMPKWIKLTARFAKSFLSFWSSMIFA